MGMVRSGSRATEKTDLANRTGYEWMVTTMSGLASRSAGTTGPSAYADEALEESARLAEALRNPSWRNAFQRRIGRVNAATLYCVAAPGMEKMGGIVEETFLHYDALLESTGGD